MKKASQRIIMLVMVIACLCAILAVPAAATEKDPITEAKKGVVKLYVVPVDSEGTPFTVGGYRYAFVGSGFAIGEEDKAPEYFVTNWHVAHANDEERGIYFPKENVRIWIMRENFTISDVTGFPSEATAIECKIVTSPESGYPDYAVLQSVAPVKDVIPLAIRSSADVKEHEEVTALGYPAVIDNIGLNYVVTETSGKISQTEYTMAAAGNTKTLLHDAIISGGNSGGPLVDSNGNVIGINTYGIQNNYSCSVYVDYVTDELDHLGISYMKAGEKSSNITVIAVGAAVAVVLVAVFFILRGRKPGKNNEVYGEKPRTPSGQTAPVGVTFSLELPDGRIVPIRDKVVTVGRDPSCQVVLPESASTAGRKHCTLENGGQYLILVDNGSTNGTYIHGKKVPVGAKVALKRGSSFSVGSVENRITVR